MKLPVLDRLEAQAGTLSQVELLDLIIGLRHIAKAKGAKATELPTLGFIEPVP